MLSLSSGFEVIKSGIGWCNDDVRRYFSNLRNEICVQSTEKRINHKLIWGLKTVPKRWNDFWG
jgi:hypothetical protein